MKNKVILFTINSKSRLYGLTEENYSAIQPNITMGLLASYLESKDIEVEMIDETYDYSIPKYVKYLDKEQPLLAGIICVGANPSSSTMSMVGTIQFFQEWNKTRHNTKMFVMGGHPSVTPERTIKETKADYVIIGEGYQTIVELYKALVKKRTPYFSGLYCNYYRSKVFPPLMDVNDLPTIDWSKMNPSKYRAHNWHSFWDISKRSPYAVIWTSFGCPYTCSYCSINNLFGKRTYRTRDMKSVVAEIDLLVKKYKVKNVKILDELFITKSKRMDEFCDMLEERNYDLNFWAYARMDTVTAPLLKRLKKIGLNWVAYGFETPNKDVLATVKKGYDKTDFYDAVIKMTKAAGINICADIIFGLWNDNEETIKETYDFCCKYNFEWLNVYPMFAYPGTPLYEEYVKEGRIKEPKSWEEYALYGYNCRPCPTKYLTSAKTLKLRDEYFLKYHSRPEYLKMIKDKFSLEVRNHIMEMIKYPLKRKILE